MTPTRIYTIAAAALDVPRRPVIDDETAGGRWPVIRARHAAWWLARDVLGLSWKELGRFFGESPQRIRYGVLRTVDRRIEDTRIEARTDAARDFMRADLRREGRAA